MSKSRIKTKGRDNGVEVDCDVEYEWDVKPVSLNPSDEDQDYEDDWEDEDDDSEDEWEFDSAEDEWEYDDGEESKNEVNKKNVETITDEKDLPKNKQGISIFMNVNSKDADIIRESLKEAGHYKLAEDFETRRELGIMHEIKKNGGIANCLEVWANGDYYKETKKPLYKMRHKVLAKCVGKTLK